MAEKSATEARRGSDVATAALHAGTVGRDASWAARPVRPPSARARTRRASCGGRGAKRGRFAFRHRASCIRTKEPRYVGLVGQGSTSADAGNGCADSVGVGAGERSADKGPRPCPGERAQILQYVCPGARGTRSCVVSPMQTFFGASGRSCSASSNRQANARQAPQALERRPQTPPRRRILARRVPRVRTRAQLTPLEAQRSALGAGVGAAHKRRPHEALQPAARKCGQPDSPRGRGAE